MDETSYITWSRYAILKGETYPISLPTKSDLVYLIKGRFFWTLLIASFIGATGLAAYHSYVMSSMFLPIIALTSTLLIPTKFKESKILEVAVFTIILTNPLLLLFSGFILNDLAISFYLLLATLFFIRSFNQSPQGKTLLNLYSLLFSFLILIVASLIKENIVIVLPMYFILVFYILRYKLHKSSKIWRGVLSVLTLPLIAYEILVDIPYVISTQFVRNSTLAWLTAKFLFISPAEWVLGIFIPAPWKPTTIFSYNFYDYLHFLYRMLSPEALNPIISGVGVILPLMLTLEGLRRNVRARLLIYIATTTLWFTYILYLSMNAFWDIPRYFLFMVPILIIVSLTALYEILSSKNIAVGGMLILSMVVLLLIQSFLISTKGGVYISYGLSKLNWTDNILIIQVIIYTILILLAIFGAAGKILLTFSLRKKFEIKTTINVKILAFIILIIVALVANLYFSVYSILNSSFYRYNRAKSVEPFFNTIKLNNTFVVSNFYTYMRPYAPDYLIRTNYLFPPPMTENEFKDFLRIAPNNTLLVVSHDPDITWYEYGNRYIKKYVKSNLILLEPKHKRVIYEDLLLDLRSSDSINGLKLLSMIDGITVFRIRTPIQLHMQDNSRLVNITSVKIYFTNTTNVRLTIRADAIDERKVFIIIGTIRFLKVLTADLKPGQNEMSWDFKTRLEDRSAYGLYIASMAKVIIYDENGSLLYNKMHSCFTLSGVYLLLWILILIMLVFFTLFLSRRL